MELFNSIFSAENLVKFEASDFSTSSDSSDYVACGRFGSVRVCRHLRLGKVVAKCFGLDGENEEICARLASVRRETTALVRIRHSNIVQLHGFATWDKAVAIILEHVGRGSLHAYLKACRGRNLDWNLRLRFAGQLVSALSYLHNERFVHGDVKSENVLLTHDLDVKLADFGAVSVVAGGRQTHEGVTSAKQYTPLYAAPEVYCGCAADTSADIYSFGMVLYEIVTTYTVYFGHKPSLDQMIPIICRGERPNEKYVLMAKRLIDSAMDNAVFILLTDLMRKCWHKSPQSRPNVHYISERIRRVPASYSKGRTDDEHYVSPSFAPQSNLSHFGFPFKTPKHLPQITFSTAAHCPVRPTPKIAKGSAFLPLPIETIENTRPSSSHPFQPASVNFVDPLRHSTTPPQRRKSTGTPEDLEISSILVHQPRTRRPSLSVPIIGRRSLTPTTNILVTSVSPLSSENGRTSLTASPVGGGRCSPSTWSQQSLHFSRSPSPRIGAESSFPFPGV